MTQDATARQQAAFLVMSLDDRNPLPLHQLRSNRTATELIDTKNTHFEDYNQQALVVR